MIAIGPISGTRLSPLLAASLWLTGVCIGPVEDASARVSTASAARVTPVSDHARLHGVGAYGNTLIEEGRVEGTLQGRVKVRLNIEVENRTATSRFTFYLRGGNLVGHASGKATTGEEGWESFGGEMWLDHGTGRYAHASGSGRMYGALNRNTDVLIVQVVGRARGL
jgi:hypothetical protein